MLLKTLICIFSLIILISCHQHWWENTQVLELTTQNFYDYVSKDQNLIVEFYAPWCYYCQAMFQQYEELRKLYNGENPKRNDVIIAKINGHSNEQIPQIYNIYSYPMIVHFKPGSRDINSYFQSYRTKDAMSQWIEEIIGPEKKPEPEPVKEDINEDIGEDINEIRPKGKKTMNKRKIEENEKDMEINENSLKIMDILITVADQLKFLDKNHKEGNEKIVGALEQILKNNGYQGDIHGGVNKLMNGLNVKHAMIFFMLGLLLGISLAFMLIRFRRLNTQVKSV